MADAGLARVREIEPCQEHAGQVAGAKAVHHTAFGCDACLSLLVAAIRAEALEQAAEVARHAGGFDDAVTALRGEASDA